MNTVTEGTARNRAVPSGSRRASWEQEHAPGRFGWLFAGIWLIYLVQPLRQVWTATATPVPLRVLGVAALLAFAAGFLWFFAWWRNRRVHVGRPPAARSVLLVLLAGVGLLALVAPAGGDTALAGLVYVGVAAAITLPPRHAAAVVAVLVGLVLVLPRVLPGWTPDDAFVPQLLLGCFAAFGIGQVIERNAQLARAREQLVDLAVTQERERMGRDVHDILGHSLTVITVKTELAGRLLEAVPETPELARVRAELADVERLGREALADVRATVTGMRQLSLTGELAAARLALDAAGITAELPSAVDDVLPSYRELFAFALREGVTNVVRHSGATRCVVLLTGDSLEVRDDGRGPSGTVSGAGLNGMRERAAAVGARVDTGTSDEGGFLLRVTRA